MKVEQFVMAYRIEQDRVRAMLPEGFESLRPVLRINAEVRDEKEAYVEFNAPVSHGDVRGWLNIAHWNSDEVTWSREGNTVRFTAQFLDIEFTGTGAVGGCPAGRDNDGCYFREGDGYRLVPTENITENKEFCDCRFAWKFADGDAHGVSIGEKTVGATLQPAATSYPRAELTAPNAAHLPCLQMLGQYKVTFERK